MVEATDGAPIDRVWRAITDEAEMPRWFFEQIASFRPEVGAETQFTVHVEGRDYVHLWRVTEVVAPKRIAYDWNYGGVPGASAVVWELSETAGGTHLRLTHSGTETFPQDDVVFQRASCQGGWQYFLLERLKTFLEQPPVR